MVVTNANNERTACVEAVIIVLYTKICKINRLRDCNLGCSLVINLYADCCRDFIDFIGGYYLIKMVKYP